MLYDPVQQGTGIFSGGEAGKNIPALGPFKNFKPNIIGPGGGKIKAVIKGGVYVARYFRRNPRFGARIAAVGVGYGVSRYAASNKYRKAFQSRKSVYSRKWRNFRKDNSRRCECARCCCG